MYYTVIPLKTQENKGIWQSDSW